jgi:hypothetical protein
MFREGEDNHGFGKAIESVKEGAQSFSILVDELPSV